MTSEMDQADALPGTRYSRKREAEMYAKAGVGLAKAWRLAAKVSARELAGHEKTYLNNLRQATEKAARKALKQALHEQQALALKNERMRRDILHHNAPPYRGRLLNPVNWDVHELCPSGETGRRAGFKPRHIAGSSPATGTITNQSLHHTQSKEG